VSGPDELLARWEHDLRAFADGNGTRLNVTECIELADIVAANAALAARLEKAESDLELALGSREQFTAERLLYLIRQDFDCLPECDSYGHAENCPYVGGPAQLDALAARCGELERDAERYRWLRANPNYMGWEHDFLPQQVDREIDRAALASQAEGET
jgi:hypothetical protein